MLANTWNNHVDFSLNTCTSIHSPSPDVETKTKNIYTHKECEVPPKAQSKKHQLTSMCHTREPCLCGLHSIEDVFIWLLYHISKATFYHSFGMEHFCWQADFTEHYLLMHKNIISGMQCL